MNLHYVRNAVQYPFKNGKRSSNVPFKIFYRDYSAVLKCHFACGLRTHFGGRLYLGKQYVLRG